MYDLKIEGGTIVDGRGEARFAGDVAIKDGRIAALGRCDEPARRTLDARGAIVTPGFVDLHTHYDGQISWDDELAPSCYHGVTTAVMGNCGVGFAPVKKSDHEKLIRLMEGVEDIPGSALSEGIRWGWESFGEYMNELARTPRTIDFACQVPHDALRVYAMGARAIAEEAATDDDIARMRALLREALEAGAVGFSTGRSDNHRSADGKPTPASESSARELAGLAEAFCGRASGVLQAVSDFDMFAEEDRFEAELAVLLAMARTSGRPLSLSLMQRDQAPDQWKRILAGAEAAQREGLAIRVQCAPRAIGVLLGLEATFHPFIGFPSYKAIAHLPREERVRIMRDERFRERLLGETSDKVSGDGSAIPPLADMLLARIDMVALRLFRFGERPRYEPTMEESIYAEGHQRGVPALRAVYDALLEDDGRELLYFPLYNYTEFDLDNVRTMMTHPLALPGLSDGGAHVGTVCDASFPTFYLTHWARDREHGRLGLERVVKMLAHDTACHMGFADRGSLEVGKRADLNVIDFDALHLERPRLVGDLPAGGKRLMQRARGYLATVVGGEVVIEGDELTEARPGRLVRG